MPLFINEGGSIRATYVWNGKNYPLHLAQRMDPQAATWQTLTSGDVKGRGPALLIAGP